jgi:osmotically-inducible protein OsmY
MKAQRSSFAIFTAICACALAGCSLPATLAKCGLSGCAGDAQITADIRAKLYSRPDIFDGGITVQTLDRIVYLYGIVDTDPERFEVIAIARGVPGVTDVVDSISIRNNAAF